MLFPKHGGYDDGRSVFVIIKNNTSTPFEPKQFVLVPRDAELKDDGRYIPSCWVKVDHEYILPGNYGNAKLISAEFWAD